jgi:hypothetical protein
MSRSRPPAQRQGKRIRRMHANIKQWYAQPSRCIDDRYYSVDTRYYKRAFAPFVILCLPRPLVAPQSVRALALVPREDMEGTVLPIVHTNTEPASFETPLTDQTPAKEEPRGLVPLWLRPFRRGASLRSQLLTGLAALLAIALVALAVVILLWLPLGFSADSLAVGLLLSDCSCSSRSTSASFCSSAITCSSGLC